MTTLAELIKRDSVEAHWFWVDSISAGPYAENEQFDATFVRDTNMVVGGGYNKRRTLYVQGITTAQVDSRREHGGEIVNPELDWVLPDLLNEAADIDNYPVIRDWIDATRDKSAGYMTAVEDLEARERAVHLRNELRAWLGDAYDEYIGAERD